MPRDARKVMTAFEQKGLVRREGQDGYYPLHVEGKKTPVFTKISQGEKGIHDGLLAIRSRQLKLNKRQFGELVECPLTQEEYVKLLRDGGHVA